MKRIGWEGVFDEEGLFVTALGVIALVIVLRIVAVAFSGFTFSILSMPLPASIMVPFLACCVVLLMVVPAMVGKARSLQCVCGECIDPRRHERCRRCSMAVPPEFQYARREKKIR